MKPTLKNQPNSYTYKNALKQLEDGKPLAPDFVHFFSRHESSLGPLLKYYLKPYHHHAHEETHSFLMPEDKLNPDALDKLKKRLDLMLQSRGAHAQFKMTPEQFTLMKQAGYPELILYHGNQFLTGAPYYLGGIPHVIFFQWGNLFGVAKYVVLAEEKALRSNVLVYFEDMQERYLDQCVQEYVHSHRHELTKEHQQQLQNNTPAPKEMPAPTHYRIPRLTLSINTGKKGDEEK